MKIGLADKFIAWLTLTCGLSLSAVAIYYSVAGLVSIFAAAVIPIVIMGTVLEISKLVATVWLKQNWFIAPRAIKGYLLVAIFLLMFITSMGIFGYLSKAHMDQSLVSGDVTSKIALFDEKIKTEKDNIDAARRALKQMDEAVDQTMARSDSERGAERAVQIRRQQQAERARLQKDIATAQSNITKLNEERAPIAAEVRKVEAEVGPIKYIAALIYGDNPDQNLLESAVRWVIIVIVVVFDPLAVILLLASQYSFQWFRDRKPEEENLFYVADVGEKPTAEELKDEEDSGSNKGSDVLDNTNDYKEKQRSMSFVDPGEHPADRIEYEEELVEEPKPHHPDTHPYLRQGFNYPPGWMFGAPLVAQPEETVEEILETDSEEVKALKIAKANWKAENPNDTLKRQERLYEMGVIDALPWETVELLDEQKEAESKKKSSYIIKEQNEQVTKTKE